MLKRLVFAVCVVVTFVFAEGVWGFSLKVDIGATGQAVKSGWEEFSGGHQVGPESRVYVVDSTSVTVDIRIGNGNDSGYRNYYPGGNIGGDMVYPDSSSDVGPVDGQVILTFSNLPAGSYTLDSYHNDSKATHMQFDPIDVEVSGAVSSSTSDVNVSQTKNMVDDNGLGHSLVTFTATGLGDVVVTYTPTTSSANARATVNGFELEATGPGSTIVQFESAESSGTENVNPAVIAVVLDNAPEANAVTVHYTVTGGTAQGGGVDYALSDGIVTFDPCVTSQNIEIGIVDDGEIEDDETIEVTLFSPGNAVLGPTYRHTYTIVDINPSVTFDASSGEGREDVSPAYIGVSLSKAWAEPVTVDYNVTGGTAVNGEDYVLSAGTVRFDPCEVSKNISVTIFEDEYEEDPDETIEITLSDANNAKLGGIIEHTFTILPGIAQVCPGGDMDGDCDVDFNDVRIFAGQWLEPSGGCSGAGCADIDGINGVNMSDFALLAKDWLGWNWPVVINEFMASNGTTLWDPNEPNEAPDWLELYNGGSFTVVLNGMYLTDDLSNPTKWQIPSGVSIGSGEYLLFYADDDDEQGPMHTNFKLSSSGEEIGLFASDGVTLLDSVTFGEQVSDISYGRYPDGSDNQRFFATPTPGAENSGAYLGEVADTQFSHHRGFYDSPFLLSIWCDTSGSEIHYTVDGNEPDETVGGSTRIYDRAILINDTTTLRAAAFKSGYLPSNVDTHSYIFGANSARKALPTISLVSAELVDRTGPVSMELIYGDANDGEGFQTDCESEAHSSHSYRIKFKAEFGNAQLNYPFFETCPFYADWAVDKFDRLVLRGGNNMPTTWVAEPWTRISQLAMSGAGHGGHSTYMHLYVNGVYQGLINPVERPDAWFASSYFGGDFEDYFATNHHELCWRGEHYLSGDPNRYETLLAMAGDENLEDPGNYEVFKNLCDVKQFADYTILYWYSGFGDGVDNNWYAFMRNDPLFGEVPPEGYMLFMWDAEFCFTSSGGPPGSTVPRVPDYYWTLSGCGDYVPIVRIWRALSENQDFMMLFVDRIYKHFFNDGALTDENAQARWDVLYDYIASGGVSPYLEPSWAGFSGFRDIFMSALYSKGLYPSIDPPTYSKRGGHVATGFGFTMSNPNGSGIIYYTLDGSDPREAVTGNPVGTAYSSGTITLNESRHVKARVYDGFEWSALNEVTFAVGPVVENLRITELMYHSPDGNDPNEEFIELQNVGAELINLNLVKFANGIDFTFGPVGLSSGEYVVVVQDANGFIHRHPSFSGIIAGEYDGRFNNAGERIELVDAVGDTILDFRYKDDWREITDGGGFSLTIIDANDSDANSWGDKASWRSSVFVGGSPGEDDSGILPNPGSVVINEVMAHSHDLPDWIELHNTTGGAIDIGGWFVSDSDLNVTKYEFEAGTSIGGGEYLVLYEDVNFGNPNDLGSHSTFALSENGEKVILSSGLDGNGKLTGYREVEDFGASESDISFGRYYKKSTGNYNFVAMDQNTPGRSNAYPKVGPIVISEIMYHPDWPTASLYGNEEYEFVELHNISGMAVTLYDYYEEAPWKFSEGIDFTFPDEPPVTIPAGGRLLVVKNPEAFMWCYPNVPSWKILGPYDGKLSNSGEKVELSMPGDVDESGRLCYIRVDRISYSDGSHPKDCPGGVDLWDVGADGGGKSLTRIADNLYGNDPNNWIAIEETPESTVSVLLINEFMAANTITIQDDYGEYDDWIEICNMSTRTIDIGEMYLTDDLGNPTKWQIPVGVSINGGEYLLFWADGQPGQGDLHADFGLSAGGGEDVGLFDTNGVTLIDGLTNFPAQSSDNSYGRWPDGTDNWDYFSYPTPGRSN